MKYFESKAIHQQAGKKNDLHSKTTPIYQTSAFSFQDLDDLESFFIDEERYMYTRYGNPNTDQLAKMVASLEEAPEGVATSSGMSAILAGVLAVVKPGDHMLIPEDVYGGTYDLFHQFLTDWNVTVNTAPFNERGAIEAAITDETTLIYTETETNPLLRVEDLNEVIAVAKNHNVAVMVDNTFATPYFVQPMTLGADLVVHSATKYIGGHSDVTVGVLVGTSSWMEKAKKRVIQLGMNVSPFEAWLTVRGLKTLAVRMKQQSDNAAAVAAYLREQEGVKVYYPMNLSDKGNGAMVSFDLGAGYDIETFFKELQWIKIVPTLAGVETTVSYPLKTSHRSIPKPLQEKLGITDGLVRMSVGLEHSEEVREALQIALSKAKK
ncbi:PLP-dependent aspartate aminotransferase family protein [Geomicrobium sp. JCM 19038]|uniref:trans-sulfuration enzyme family protein n=1 Tax=Geomicrobium sp. JCM 19038 TaxID=1460635 RepID=UPI00045F3CDA|nr:aminotransferase class I/II-fold pyridoxal phosphate-dependent enzyme [Geomicrobium sp. JCM 19038]GAK10080.1 O-acetylhomoserine sulfhydrylase [Geomicrobium sp. JCM 19038]